MATKPSDARNMTADEIKNKITLVREELFKLRFEQASGRVEKPHRIRQARRDLARFYTILKEKEDAESGKKASS